MYGNLFTMLPSPRCTDVRRFQKLRKKAGLVVTDTVEVYYEPAGEAAAAVLQGMLGSDVGATVREGRLKD